MKIAIEAQRIFRKNKHGMDFVALELIKALQQIDTVNEYYILIARGDDKCLSSTSNFHIIETGRITNYFLWEQVVLPLALRRIHPDVVHCTSNTAPLFCILPMVLTLHDIIFMEKKIGKNVSMYQTFGRWYRRFVVPRIVHRARQIMTVSNFEKGQILEGITIPPDKITTVYNGVGSEFTPLENVEPTIHRYIEKKGYWFLLGNTDPKKNLENILLAYAGYARKQISPKPLLIADLDKEYLSSLLEKAGISFVQHLISTPGYISHQDLPSVYNGAFAFLYPSLRESFGLPLLEAMACGRPVITSKTSALPEIAGTQALLVNPENVEEITSAMIELENSSSLYEQQVEIGFKRSAEFSWKKTATETLAIYEKVAKHG